MPTAIASSASSSSVLRPADFGLPAHFPVYRPGQDDISLELAADLDRYRFALCSAPPGAGKSLIANTVAAVRGARTLYLTGTKGLQAQLLGDFSSIGMVDIRGHSNYACADRDSERERDEPVCSWGPKQCLYRKDVERAVASRLVVSNYAYWMTLRRYGFPGSELTIGNFDLLVCDEAHTALDWVTQWMSVELTQRDLKRCFGLTTDLVLPPTTATQNEWMQWAEHVYQRARERYTELKDEDDLAGAAASSESTRERRRTMRRLAGVGRDLGVLSAAKGLWVASKTSVAGAMGTKFSPVWPSAYCEWLLFREIPNVLLTSATLPPSTIAHLGMPPTKTKYKEVGSTFPVRNRPVIYVPTTAVSYNMTSGQTTQWTRRLDEIVESRSAVGRKGIIHCQSYKRGLDYADRSRFRDSLLLVPTSRNTRELVEIFRTSTDPVVLVSPALKEGWDFPNDVARYQVIAKLPFADARDPVLDARFKTDKKYRTYLAALEVLQMAGRVVRSDKDWGETFIIDDNWGKWFRAAAKYEFPQWFKDAWIECAQLPAPMSEPIAA